MAWLVAVGVMSSAAAVAQPYVTVPSGCVVLVPGQGTPGADQVGKYGVIGMNDAFAGGTFSIAGVTSVIDWQMLGDLSRTQGVNPPAAATRSIVGNNPAVGIESYNKNLRTGFETANPFIARSKGRITVNYVRGDRNDFVTFDVLKRWDSPNPGINGPNCWLPSTSYVYAVDIASGDNVLDNIGFDKYYWQVTDAANTPVGTFANNSAESSSVLYTTPSVLNNGPYTIKCCFGQNNPWNNGVNTYPPTFAQMDAMASCMTKPIQLPLAPAYTGGFPTCVNALSPTLPITVVSSNPNCAYTYTWTRSNLSWTFLPSGTCGSSGIIINGIGDGNPCTFFLNLTGPCGSSAYSYTINRSYTAGFITPTTVCVSTGTNVLTLNTPINGQGNQTCWGTIPAGWGWTNVGSSGRTFTIPASAAGSTNTIQMRSCACPTPVTTITVNVRPATPGIITAPPCVDPGTSYPFSVPQAGVFTWTAPGWTGGGTTPAVNFTPSGAGTVSVVLNGQVGCPSLPASATVNIFPVIVQPTCINTGVVTTGAIFTSNVAGTGWSFHSGLTASVPPAGTTATINIIGTAGSYLCSATANGCITFFTVVVPVIPSVSPTNYLTQASNVAGSSTVWVDFNPADLYRLFNCTTNLPVSGWTSLQSAWQLIAPGTGSFTVQVDTPPLNCGFFHSPCVATNFQAMVLGGDQDNVAPMEKNVELGSGAGVVINPNPSDGQFTVNVLQDFKVGRVLFYDAGGKRVGNTERLVPGSNSISQRDLAPGVYQLFIELDDKVERRSIVITKDH